jgi:GTP-binding protein EngB required for normal cell division
MTETRNNNEGSKKIETRNVLLIGRTGNGKSTLANVLTNTEKFKESASCISETREIQTENFVSVVNDEEVVYKVIDTIGIGDTKLSDKEVLRRISEASYHLKNDGLCQILFVINGRLTDPEKEAYNIMREVLFGDEITKYTTIVKTNFTNFDDEESCEEETRKIHEEDPTLSEILKRCNRIIYVDNPSVDEKQKPLKIAAAKESRETSRKILIDHLTYKCGNYYPTKITELNERVESYMTEKEKLQKELDELKLKREQGILEREKIEKKVSDLEAKEEKRIKEEAERAEMEQENKRRLAELECKIEEAAKETLT